VAELASAIPMALTVPPAPAPVLPLDLSAGIWVESENARAGRACPAEPDLWPVAVAAGRATTGNGFGDPLPDSAGLKF
jgi:hypothetical protein